MWILSRVNVVNYLIVNRTNFVDLHFYVVNYLIVNRTNFVDLHFYKLLVKPVLMNVRIFYNPVLLFRLKMCFVI